MDFLGLAFFLPLVLGPLSIFFPNLVKKVTDKYPPIFYITFFIAIIIQFPIMFFGSWGVGASHAENSFFNDIINFAPVMIILLIILITSLSLFFQKIWKLEEQSLGIALLGGLISGPVIYLILVNQIASLNK